MTAGWVKLRADRILTNFMFRDGIVAIVGMHFAGNGGPDVIEVLYKGAIVEIEAVDGVFTGLTYMGDTGIATVKSSDWSRK